MLLSALDMRNERAGDYPKRGISLCVAMGNTMPPMDEPTAVKPRASPRLRWNQWPTTLKVGPNIVPHISCKKVGNGNIIATRVYAYPGSNSLTQDELPVL